MNNTGCCWDTRKSEAETIACIHKACPCAMRSSQFVIHQGCLSLATNVPPFLACCVNPCTPSAIRILTPDEIQLLNEAKIRAEKRRLKQMRKAEAQRINREKPNPAREMMRNYSPSNAQYRQGFHDGRASVIPSTYKSSGKDGSDALFMWLLVGLLLGIAALAIILVFAALLL